MYCPDVKVSTTEMMGMEMKKAIAQFLFTTLNCSYKTAYEYMGLHAEDELRKRQAELRKVMTMCLWLARPLIHRPVVPAVVVTVIKRQAVQKARKLKNKFMISREMKIVSEVMNDE